MSDDYERLGLKKDANYEDLVKAYGEKSLELTNEADIAKLNESAAFIAKKIKELNQEKTTLPSGEEVTVEEIKKAIDEKINKVHIDYDNSVPKPRNRKINETDEEYEDYLEDFYQLDNIDYKNERIPNTTYFKPRDREINETDEHYEQFLQEYYTKVFNSSKNEKIDGREVDKPRDRKIDENDKNYEKFLGKYYKENVTPVPKVAFGKGKKHKVVSHKENLRHKLMRKFLIVATWATIGLSALFGLKGLKNKTDKVDSNKNKNSIEQIDNTATSEKEIKDQIAEEVNKIINNEKRKSPNLGDLVKIDKGTKFYYDSQRSKPTGYIGNEYAPVDTKYVITGEAIIDKDTNDIVATNFNKNESLKDTFLHGNEKNNYRRMVLVSSKKSRGAANTKYNYGWIKDDGKSTIIEGKLEYQKEGKGK